MLVICPKLKQLLISVVGIQTQDSLTPEFQPCNIYLSKSYKMENVPVPAEPAAIPTVINQKALALPSENGAGTQNGFLEIFIRSIQLNFDSLLSTGFPGLDGKYGDLHLGEEFVVSALSIPKHLFQISHLSSVYQPCCLEANSCSCTGVPNTGKGLVHGDES